VFSFYFRRKTLSRSCEKFKNIILFTDYNKFDHQIFDWIYFVLNIVFSSISPLRIWFNLIFILTLVLIFIIVIFFLIIFLIKIFYLSNLVLILLIVTYFIWNNLWNYNYNYCNFIIFNFFYLLNLISVILIVIYFIWDNLWNWIFFSISFLFNFLICKICFLLF
jgi:hypothetical protein